MHEIELKTLSIISERFLWQRDTRKYYLIVQQGKNGNRNMKDKKVFSSCKQCLSTSFELILYEKMYFWASCFQFSVNCSPKLALISPKVGLNLLYNYN